MTVYIKTFASHLKQFRLICFYLTSYTEQFRSQSKKKHIILEEEFLPTNTTNWLGFVYNTSQNDKYFEADFVGHHRQSVPFQKLVLYKLATIDILSFFQTRFGRSFLVMCLLQLPLAIIRVVVIYLYQYSAGRKPHKNIFLFTLQKYGIHA